MGTEVKQQLNVIYELAIELYLNESNNEENISHLNQLNEKDQLIKELKFKIEDKDSELNELKLNELNDIEEGIVTIYKEFDDITLTEAVNYRDKIKFY